MAIYNPQDHIVQNKGTGVIGKPVDARSWWTDGIQERPFASVAEVLGYFDTDAKRKGNFTIFIGDVAYGFVGGTGDANLVPVGGGTVENEPVADSLNPISSGYTYDLNERVKALAEGNLAHSNGILQVNDTEVKLNLEYYAGVWAAGPYQKGWLVLSTDRKKVWKVKQNHTSATEPAAGVNWELLFEIPGIDANPVENGTNGISSGYLFTLKQQVPVVVNGQLQDAAGNPITISMDNAPVQNSTKPVKSAYFFEQEKVYPRYDVETKVWRDYNGNTILSIDEEPVLNSPFPVASGYLYAQQQTQVYYVGGRLIDFAGNEITITTEPGEGVTYVHPETHAPSIITQDAFNRFVTDLQISRWNDTYTTATIENKLNAIGEGKIWKGWVATYSELLSIAAPQDNWTYVVQDASDDPNIGNKPFERVDYRYDAVAGVWLNLGQSVAPLVTYTVHGLMLSTDKQKLDGIQAQATKNSTDAQLRDRSTHTGTQPISSVEGLQDALNSTVNTDFNSYATGEIEDTAISAGQKAGSKFKYTFLALYNWLKARFDTVYAKLEQPEPSAPTGVRWLTKPVITIEGQNISVHNTAKAEWNGTIVTYGSPRLIQTGTILPAEGLERFDAISGTVSGSYDIHEGQVSANPVTPAFNVENLFANFVKWNSTGGVVTGYLTQAEGDARYELKGEGGSDHFKGTYTNLTALQTAHPTASAGNYAHVDAGEGADVASYIWDNDDSKWVLQAGASTAETAASIKTKYESNADTNAFTDAEKDKLANLVNNVSSWQSITGDGTSTLAALAGDPATIIAVFGPYGRKELNSSVSENGVIYEVLRGTLAPVQNSGSPSDDKFSHFIYAGSASFDLGAAITEIELIDVVNSTRSIYNATSTISGNTVTISHTLETGDSIRIHWK